MLCRTAYIMLTSGAQRGVPEATRAIALLEDGHAPQLLGEALETRGDILSLLGEQAKAMLDFQRARAAYGQAGISEVEPLMLSIAVAYRRMGDTEQALRHFAAGIRRMQARADWEGVATHLIQLGFLYDESGAPERSLVAFQQALAVATAHRLPDSINPALLGVAEAQIALGQGDAALRSLADARAGFAARQDASSEDSLLLLEGQALARLGRHADALDRYRKALPLMRQDGNNRYLALLFKSQAASLEALGHEAAALSDYKRYTELELKLQGKMRLEQGRLLEYEYAIRRGEFENRRLRAETAARQQEVRALERVRRWQWITIVLGALLLALLSSLAWRHGRASRRLSRESLIDPLTGIANRAAIEADATRALQHGGDAGKPIAMLMLDLDHFKAINDRHGHAAGDAVIRLFAVVVRDLIRDVEVPDPVLARLGGEEFAALLPGRGLVEARQIGEAVAARFAETSAEGIRATVSIGLAEARPGPGNLGQLLDSADRALYRAKALGRNRVEVAEPAAA